MVVSVPQLQFSKVFRHMLVLIMVVLITTFRHFSDQNTTKDPALLVLPTCTKYLLAV